MCGNSDNKKEFYLLLGKQLASLVEGESHAMPNLSNASALIYNELDGLNWAGFYIMCGGELLLGPFQGKTACVHIPIGRGVCGTAVKENKLQRIANVHEFAGHIACDCASNSEIVIPLHDKNGEIVGVLDIDSVEYDRFDEEDEAGLIALMEILEKSCIWENKTL